MGKVVLYRFLLSAKVDLEKYFTDVFSGILYFDQIQRIFVSSDLTEDSKWSPNYKFS